MAGLAVQPVSHIALHYWAYKMPIGCRCYTATVCNAKNGMGYSVQSHEFQKRNWPKSWTTAEVIEWFVSDLQ